MSIQTTVVLDSGVFLQEGKKPPYSSIEVGYFNPIIAIYVDGEEFEVFKLTQVGKRLEISFDAGGGPSQRIAFSQCMDEKILKVSRLYRDCKPPARMSDPFDTTIIFNAGHFRCSAVKERFFYEMHGKEKAARKSFGPIAHDVVIEYDLGDHAVLSLKDGLNFAWSTAQVPQAKRRIDIEILAEDSTVEKFYLEAFGIDPETESDRVYYLPNQGHPPPIWVP